MRASTCRSMRNGWRAVFPGGKLDLSRVHEVPILTRAQAQANVKALAALNLPPHVGAIETEETSGSTGRPFVAPS